MVRTGEANLAEWNPSFRRLTAQSLQLQLSTPTRDSSSRT
ncbi:hypothetical protein CJF30_00002408 [Rutstroemia sp. NJR-2017a BBW]|nr:hypothetical protein CJF30_00002408 [Rutstroemia sp. NJR-2017a BBW]